MPSILKTIVPAAASLLAAMASLPATAQGPAQDSLTIGIGAGVSTRFPGSDQYQPIPFPSIEYKFGGRALRTNQLGLEFDVSKDRMIDFGPIIRLNTGRNDFQDAGDPVVEALGQVNAAIELGGFISASGPIGEARRGPPALLWTTRATVMQATGGHDGLVVEASAGLVKPSRTWTYVGTINASYASGAYQSAFFGVDAAGATASGLAQFEAGGGFRDIGATGVVSYRISPKWTATSILSYARLVGDAANSPIVTERGSPNQLFFGVNIAYTVF